MCQFRTVWWACANFETGHGHAGRFIFGQRLCARYPYCELLLVTTPIILQYDCYDCMEASHIRRRNNILLAMQRMQMPVRGIPERAVPVGWDRRGLQRPGAGRPPAGAVLGEAAVPGAEGDGPADGVYAEPPPGVYPGGAPPH